MNATFRNALAALTLVALFALQAHADPWAGSTYGLKTTGTAFWPLRASARRVEAARNYAQEVQLYVKEVQQPNPSVVKDIKAELGKYLEEAQLHLAAMKKANADDKETVAAIEGMDKELAAAIEHNKAMIICCENQKFDKIATMSCCTDLVKQLDKVHADHVALMKKLAGAPAAKK